MVYPLPHDGVHDVSHDVSASGYLPAYCIYILMHIPLPSLLLSALYMHTSLARGC